MSEPLLTRYLQPLLAGRRSECLQTIREAVAAGRESESLMRDVLWPAMAQIERLYRDDRINTVTEHIATRINRVIADQLQPHLHSRGSRGQRVVVCCDEGESEELGAQMVCDLLQADGWETYFVGGGAPHDEIVAMIGAVRPAALVLFGTKPEGVPAAKMLVQHVREMGAVPTMNVVVSGGVFNRADGLWCEVGADVMSPTAEQLVETIAGLSPRDPTAARPPVVKKRKRKRKALAAA